MTNVQNFNRLRFLKNAIDDAIDAVRSAAEKDLPQPPRLMRNRPNVWLIFQIEDGLFQSDIPSLGGDGIFRIDFSI